MSYDTERLAGNYPPKGWGWKSAARQRALLGEHFAKSNPVIEPWMQREADRLGLICPQIGLEDKDA